MNYVNSASALHLSPSRRELNQFAYVVVSARERLRSERKIPVSKAPQVLLVDDNPADVELACEASAGGKYRTKIHSEEDGEKALAYLRRIPLGDRGDKGKDESRNRDKDRDKDRNKDGNKDNDDAIRPDLIVLDLNLPGKNGRLVLEELKRDPDLRAIPVIMFSTSQSSRDIVACYQAGANCYVNKPVSLEDFFAAIWSIEQFWFGSALLPEEGNDGSACQRSAD